ncbi:MAG: hypothetical protein ACXVX5_05565, partial [Mycobacterium sp.]
ALRKADSMPIIKKPLGGEEENPFSKHNNDTRTKFSANEVISVRILSQSKAKEIVFAPELGSYFVIADGKNLLLLDAQNALKLSVAGPAANLVLAVLLLAATRLFYDPHHAVLWAGVAFLGFLQITALLLNLLPIPGLDGYDALEPHLSPETQRAVAPAKQYGFFIVLFVLLAASPWIFGVVLWLFDFSGVPTWLVSAGNMLTRFWSRWF